MATIGDIIDISLSHIKIKNIDVLNQKLSKMIKDGKENLQVVADFDCTLTRQKPENGRKLMSSFGMFCECASVPEDYKDEDKRLCDIYKPIECDPNLTIEEKSKHMVEWYRIANSLLKDFKYPLEEMKVVSQDVEKNLRDGVKEMFKNLGDSDVPILVFSAGLGNAVTQVLECADMYTSNVKVISNFLNLNEEGLINGMKGSVIHVFNKNETAIKGTEYYDLVEKRSNVILLGDSLGDAGMADGMDHSEAVIRIGFLYDNVAGNLPLYMDAFDIVLIDDQTVDVTNAILRQILAR